MQIWNYSSVSSMYSMIKHKKGLKLHDLTFFKSVFNYSHMNIKEIVILFFMSNGCLIILQTSFHSQNFGKTDS